MWGNVAEWNYEYQTDLLDSALAPGEGGGVVLTPNFGRYVPRQSEKWARAPERAPGRAWKCGAPEQAWAVLSLKMRGSATSRFERENAGLRNELDLFWAWKCESPERPGRRGAAERFAFGLSRPWEAMNGLKWKKFWKWWSPELQNPPKYEKWWCSGTDFFFIINCENYMLRNGNSGLKMGISLAAHTQYAYIIMEVPPPPRALAIAISWAWGWSRISVLKQRGEYGRGANIMNGEQPNTGQTL